MLRKHLNIDNDPFKTKYVKMTCQKGVHAWVSSTSDLMLVCQYCEAVRRCDDESAQIPPKKQRKQARTIIQPPLDM